VRFVSVRVRIGLPCVLLGMLSGCSDDGEMSGGMVHETGSVPATDTVSMGDGTTLKSGATDSDTGATATTTATGGDGGACVTQNGQPELLWEGSVWAMERDGTYVYWSSPGIVTRAAEDGTVEIIAQDPMIGYPKWMVFDENHLYISFIYNTWHVVSVPKDGGDVETILEWSQDVRHLAINSTVLYFLTYPASSSTAFGEAYGVPLSGGSPSLVSTGFVGTFDHLLVDEGGTLYWSTSGGVVRSDPSDPGGEHVWLVESAGLSFGAAMDESHVYWTTNVDSSYEVRRVPKTGGANELLSSFHSNPQNPVIDGEYVYLRSPDTKIVRIPVTGGPAEEIVDLHTPVDRMTVGNQAIHAVVATDNGAGVVKVCIPD
jgi:hypothetical protein